MSLARLVIALLSLWGAAGTATAQVCSSDEAASCYPAAGDVESIDAIIAALYDVISGPAGQQRDWDRMRSLFTPQARLMPVSTPPEGAAAQVQYLSMEDYITRAEPILVERGFFEREIGRVTERWERIAHVFSTYDSRWTAEDPEPFSRGINSIQLMWDGTRWWITNIMWFGVGADVNIPPKYLQGL